MTEYAQNQSLAAKQIGVSRAAFVEFCRDPDFPKRTKKGWNIDRCKKWCEKNNRGKYRRGSGGTSTSVAGVTMAEASIRKTIEEAENQRIKKERQLVDQAKELGQILDADEVTRFYMQTVATVTAVHDSMADAVDRALPETPPSTDAWPEIRDRVLRLCQKLKDDAAAAMQELS